MGTFLPLSKSATSSALHISELAVLLFGLLLVVGLIGELSKSEKWKVRLRMFELMVIIGVAGELMGDGGIFVFSERLQAISEAEVARLNVEAGALRQRAAEAELKLAELNAARLPRNLPVDCFLSALKDKPAGTVTVLYQPEDPEAYSFSLEIRANLIKAGWSVPDAPSPIPADMVSGEIKGSAVEKGTLAVPSVMRVGGNMQGVSIVAKSIDGDPRQYNGTAFSALQRAFATCVGQISGSRDATLADNTFKLIVGPKH